MDEYNLDELLKASSIFSSLDEAARKRLLPCFSKIDLIANETLFYQGDPSDNVYFLVKGKLLAELVDVVGKTRIIGHIQPGETVGEMGALANEPRSLSIKAIKDAVLLKLATKDFIAICHQYPSVLFATISPMISRTTSLIQVLSTEKRNKHIVIAPANPTISLENFAIKLQEFATKYPSTRIMSEYHTNVVDENKKSIHRTVYILRSFTTVFARIAFKRANMIYVAANADSIPTIDNHLLEHIENRRLHLMLAPNLILLHPDKASMPKNTIPWLKLADFDLCHHIRMDSNKDFQRLFRFIRGKAVGLVLSGGGTRGWAHIGAIKALQAKKIPIDIIGGTSVGALVAGIYAMNQSYEEVYDKFRQMVIKSKHTISWRSLTWPIISLFNAKNYTTAQMDLFKEQQIEDLWLPYFCITSNLANSTEDVHRSGRLWEKIRASTAIPGLIPPMVINGEIHIDGGLLNNLPVDVMRQFIGTRGKVIAIELNDFTPDKNQYSFSPIQTFTDILLNKLRILKNNYKFPKLIDTFLRGLFLGSLLRNRQNSIIANIFVSLNLTKFKMLHSNPEEGKQIVQIGYDETIKQIERTKNKNITP